MERAEGQMAGTLGREVISTRQGKGAERARREPGSAPECFNRGEVAECRSDGGGEVSYPQRGTPQGGVISPLLSNLYLHEVLDRWFEHEVKPRLRGRAFEVRYADDAVLVFEHEEDARRVLAVLAKRMDNSRTGVRGGDG